MLGIYKSFGFSNGEIRKIFLIKTIILCTISCLVGTILSLIFTSKIVNLCIQSSMGLYELKILPSVPMLMGLNCLFIVVSILATWVSTRNIKRVSVRNLIIE